MRTCNMRMRTGSLRMRIFVVPVAASLTSLECQETASFISLILSLTLAPIINTLIN